MERQRDLDAGQKRMRDHLGKITGRYWDYCQQISRAGGQVEEGFELDQFLRMGEYQGIPIIPDTKYLGIQSKNIGFAMESFADQTKEYSDTLKKATPFDMEPSMHTGET